jgi:hypothetical protein
MTTLEGLFQITGWNETPRSEGHDGVKQSYAKVSQSYSGAIDGTSTVLYLMSYQAVGSALFTGFETLTATIEGKTGTVVLQHSGTFEQGVASGSFVIVAGSGNQQLAGLAGSGSFRSTENGQAKYQFSIYTAD